MSAVLEQRDPGPMARLAVVKADPGAMSEIVSDLTDAESPKTLKQIAKAWRVPYGRLAEWIWSDEGRLGQYRAALKFVADAMAAEVVDIADAAKPEDVAVAKLRCEQRMKVAGKWDRETYGERSDIGLSVGLKVEIVSFAGNVVDGEVVGSAVPQSPESARTGPVSLPASPAAVQPQEDRI